MPLQLWTFPLEPNRILQVGQRWHGFGTSGSTVIESAQVCAFISKEGAIVRVQFHESNVLETQIRTYLILVLGIL
jgi:hypothetical protein